MGLTSAPRSRSEADFYSGRDRARIAVERGHGIIRREAREVIARRDVALVAQIAAVEAETQAIIVRRPMDRRVEEPERRLIEQGHGSFKLLRVAAIGARAGEGHRSRLISE